MSLVCSSFALLPLDACCWLWASACQKRFRCGSGSATADPAYTGISHRPWNLCAEVARFNRWHAGATRLSVARPNPFTGTETDVFVAAGPKFCRIRNSVWTARVSDVHHQIARTTRTADRILVDFARLITHHTGRQSVPTVGCRSKSELRNTGLRKKIDTLISQAWPIKMV